MGKKNRLIIILSFYSHSFFLPFPIPHAFYSRRDFIAGWNILLRVVIIFAASSGRASWPSVGTASGVGARTTSNLARGHPCVTQYSLHCS